jgi:biotin transport system substrate-specific component
MKIPVKTAIRERVQAVAVDARELSRAAARPWLRASLLATVGIGVLAASAWLSVPFYPVPMTMQTLAVLLVGGLLGSRLGTATVAGYLALGLAGAPVFHGGLGGPLVLAGPTGGYLLGFLPAALLMGIAADRARKRAATTGLLRRVALLTSGGLLAEAAIYTVGVPWLALVTGMGLRQAVSVGLVPFLLGDLLKTAVAVGAIPSGRALLSRRSGWTLLQRRSGR